MIGIAMFIVLSIFMMLRTFKIFDDLKQCGAIFAEYNQSPASIDTAVTLFPFSLIAYIVLSLLMGSLIASIFALLFFIPSIWVTRKQLAVFELAGTDRVNAVKALLSRVFSTSLIGILSFLFLIIYKILMIGLNSSSPVSAQ